MNKINIGEGNTVKQMLLLALVAPAFPLVVDGELPPLSPSDEPLSSMPLVDGPAVTSKSDFSFETRKSSYNADILTSYALYLLTCSGIST